MTPKKAKRGCLPYRRVVTDSKVKVEENGKSAVFCNRAREQFHIVAVDGGLIQNQTAADYVVSKEGVGNLIVELKGREVGRACEQVLATVALVKACRDGEPLAALVVCTKVPKTDTKHQRLQTQFLRSHRARLRIRAGNNEYNFDEFFA